MLYVIAAVVVAMAGVHVIGDIVAPVFLAITLVITARPLVVLLTKRGLNRVLSMFIGMLAVFLVLLAIGFAILFAANQFVHELPQFAPQAEALLQQFHAWLLQIGVNEQSVNTFVSNLDFGRVTALALGIINQVSGVAVFFGTLLLFVAFVAIDMLDTSERGRWLKAVRPNLFGGLVDFSWRVRTYWIVNTIFALAVAIIDVGILLWLQIPLALTWGILSFVTSYIPNVGFIIGMIPPAIMGLLAYGWESMVLVIVLYTAVNFTSDMLIQPKVTADAVGLNITTTFVSLLFWTLLLGPMGAVLAVPLTLFFKCILLDTQARTNWMSVFLGGELDEGVTPSDGEPPTPSRPPSRPWRPTNPTWATTPAQIPRRYQRPPTDPLSPPRRFQNGSPDDVA